MNITEERFRECDQLSSYEYKNVYRKKHVRSLCLSKRNDVFSSHADTICRLSLHSIDSRYLLSVSRDNRIHVYDTCISTPYVLKLYNENNILMDACWYPYDTGLIASSYNKNYVHIWDTNNEQVVVSFNIKQGANEVAFNSRASTHCLLASAGNDRNVYLCDILSGTSSHILIGHTKHVTSVQWSPLSEYLVASASADQTIRFWDIRRPGCLAILNEERTQHDIHQSWVYSKQQQTVHRSHSSDVGRIQFTPNGVYLLSLGRDNRLKLWNTLQGYNTLVHYEDIVPKSYKSVFCITNDGKYVFVPSRTHVSIHDVFLGNVVHKLEHGHFSSVHCVEYDNERQIAYTGGRDASIVVWNKNCCDTHYDDENDCDNWSD